MAKISNQPHARLILKLLARLLPESYSTRSNYYNYYSWLNKLDLSDLVSYLVIGNHLFENEALEPTGS